VLDDGRGEGRARARLNKEGRSPEVSERVKGMVDDECWCLEYGRVRGVFLSPVEISEMLGAKRGVVLGDQADLLGTEV
jgi:hypothetical protein